MRSRFVWAVMLGAVCSGALTGCVGIAGRHDQSATPLTNTSGVAQRGSSELPPSENARVCLVTADALARAGKDAEAILLYEKARTQDPRNRDVSRRLAILYDRQGLHQKARDEYTQALQASPKDADLLNDLGYSCFARGLLDEAELHLSEAVAANPKHKRAWINLALVLGQKQRYAESLEAFTHGVSRAQAYSNLAFVYSTHGKIAEAKHAYGQALQLEPDLPLAREALSRLESSQQEKVPGSDGRGQFSPRLESLLGGGATASPSEPEKPRSEEVAQPTAAATFQSPARMDRVQTTSRYVPVERVGDPSASRGKASNQ